MLSEKSQSAKVAYCMIPLPQAYFRDIVGSALDHGNEANSTIK